MSQSLITGCWWGGEGQLEKTDMSAVQTPSPTRAQYCMRLVHAWHGFSYPVRSILAEENSGNVKE